METQRIFFEVGTEFSSDAEMNLKLQRVNAIHNEKLITLLDAKWQLNLMERCKIPCDQSTFFNTVTHIGVCDYRRGMDWILVHAYPLQRDHVA
jgi:hypothetical protein